MEQVDLHASRQHDFIEYSSVRSLVCYQSKEIKKVHPYEERQILSPWTRQVIELCLGKQLCSAELSEVGEEEVGWLQVIQPKDEVTVEYGPAPGEGRPPHLLPTGCCCSWGGCPQPPHQVCGWQRRLPHTGCTWALPFIIWVVGVGLPCQEICA